MKKRFTAFLLVLSLLMGFAIPAQAASVIASEAFGENVIWTVYDDGTLEFSGTGDTKKLNDYTVGNYYRHNDILQRVVFTEGITGIGAYILYDSRSSLYDGIASIHIPSTIEKIGSYAFSGLQGLREVHISDLVRWCGIQFEDNPLDNGADLYLNGTLVEELVIPGEVTALSESSFEGCTSIQSVVIHEDVEQIGDRAFTSCTNLRSVLFCGDAPEIGEFTFTLTEPTCFYPAGNATWTEAVMQNYGGTITWVPYTPGTEPVLPPPPDGITGRCGEDLTWVLEEGVLTVSGTGPMFEAADGWEWQPYADQITRVVLEEGVTSVGSAAFIFDYANLTAVEFPSTLTRIDDNAFAHAYALTDVVLPVGLTDIGMYAFIRTGITEIVIPDSVTTLGTGAFSECPDLTYVKLPASLKEIVTMSAPFNTGTHLLAGCPSLTTIQMPVYDEGFSLGGGAFADCTALTDIGFYTGTVIDESMFEGCTGLTDITISRNVTQIGTSAFEECTGLNSVTFEWDAPAFSSKKVFYGDTLTAYYPGNNATWTEDVMQNYGGEVTWVPYTGNPFTDVPADSFYYAPVMWAIEKGITNGLTDTEFGPTATCNRAQVVTFLWRAAGSPEPTSTENPFVDVQAGSFYERAVLWAVEKGITNGADATHFDPNGVCNRAQVVTFLYRAFESPAVSTEGLPFTDVPAGAWYEAPIAWAVEQGITNGLSATEFGPNASCNRAQVVTFLYRAYND